jgi:hypothetical protein
MEHGGPPETELKIDAVVERAEEICAQITLFIDSSRAVVAHNATTEFKLSAHSEQELSELETKVRNFRTVAQIYLTNSKRRPDFDHAHIGKLLARQYRELLSITFRMHVQTEPLEPLKRN